MNAPRVAVSVAVYGGSDEAQDDLRRLFASLHGVRYARARWRLIVVDQPSERGHLAEWLRAEAPEGTEIVVSPVNDGYAGAHVRALAAARAWGADYLYALNQDATVDAGFLETAVSCAHSSPNAAIVQSVVRLQQDPARWNSVGNCLHFLGYGFADGNGERANSPLPVRPHFIASGAGMLVRLSALSRIGGLFDPEYFMYHEDVDLSWRARLAGMNVEVCAASTIYHRYEFSRSTQKFYWMERNRLVTLMTHLRVATIACIVPALIVMEMGSLFFAIKNGWWRERVRAWAFFARRSSWRWIRKRRGLVQALRRVSDRSLLAHMVGRIESQETRSFLLDVLVNPFLQLYFRALRRLVFW